MSRVTTGALLAMLMATSALALPAEIDTDEDGYVNDEEFLAAVGAELIPDPEADL